MAISGASAVYAKLLASTYSDQVSSLLKTSPAAFKKFDTANTLSASAAPRSSNAANTSSSTSHAANATASTQQASQTTSSDSSTQAQRRNPANDLYTANGTQNNSTAHTGSGLIDVTA